MEASWLVPAFPEFHIYLNQIRATHSPADKLQPVEQKEVLENMQTFRHIHPCSLPASADLMMRNLLESPGILNKINLNL